MALTDFHAFKDGVRWRLVPAGVEIDGSGVERTRGAPKTVTQVWETYATEINRTARTYRVPCALIIATICTESSGRANAVRLEPGYKSDEETPNKVSPGLMQTLISTARGTLKKQVDRAWLLQAGNSIEAGTAYISQQARLTQLDPPLVAAAYNAGGLYHQTSQKNRWRLRQYPIGTAEHCDRFVRFFNDAVFMLSQHSIKPSVGIDVLVGGGTTASAASVTPTVVAQRNSSPAPSTGSSSSSRSAIAIEFASTANAADVTPYSRQVLEDILRTAGLKSAVISSTSRDPANQARVMFNNLEKYGVEHQKKLYSAAGDQVIDVYARSKAANKTSEQIKADMERKIREIGPTKVSRHASDPKVLNVFDVAPSSIKDKRAFEEAVKGDKRVSKFLVPPGDPGYHLEIPQQSSVVRERDPGSAPV